MKSLITLILITSLSLGAKVIKLAPPEFSEESIIKQLSSTTAQRKEGAHVSVESVTTRNDIKTVVHCYGTGEESWSVVFAKVKQAIDLLEENGRISKTHEIRVVGSGAMGFVSAIELRRRGFSKVAITSKELYNTSSWRSYGFFNFDGTKESLEAFETYRQIEKGNHPYISKEAVKLVPIYCNDETKNGFNELVKRKLIPRHEDVTLDFGNGVKHENFSKYMTYYFDTTRLMEDLVREVNRLKIKLEFCEVDVIDDILESVIFNCSGIGAKALVRDQKAIATRHHLLLLNTATKGNYMDAIIYAGVVQNGKKEILLLVPKTSVVTCCHIHGLPCRGALGATSVENCDKLSVHALRELDKVECEKIKERARLFFFGK